MNQRQVQADLAFTINNIAKSAWGRYYSILDFRDLQKRFGEDTHANLFYIAVFLAEQFQVSDIDVRARKRLSPRRKLCSLRAVLANPYVGFDNLTYPEFDPPLVPWAAICPILCCGEHGVEQTLRFEAPKLGNS